MIDVRIESLIPLDEAAKLAPGYHGRCASEATVRRWIRVGMRGVVLESVIAGGRRCTSRDAIQRFFTRLTEARDTPVGRYRRRTTRPTADEQQIRARLKSDHGLEY